MGRLGLLLVVIAGPAGADEWRSLGGAEITAALSARALAFTDGSTQNFFADGGTSYASGSLSMGHWRVDGDQYCSQWPPSDRWDCYGVQAENAGLDLRFVAKNGNSTTGRYIDLRQVFHIGPNILGWGQTAPP